MAGNGIQQVNTQQRQSNPQASTVSATTLNEPSVTTVTSTGELQYFSADVPSLGGTPLIVQAIDEDAVRKIYHRECAGLSPGAFIAIKPASELEIKRAKEEERVKV